MSKKNYMEADIEGVDDPTLIAAHLKRGKGIYSDGSGSAASPFTYRKPMTIEEKIALEMRLEALGLGAKRPESPPAK
ncbi:MAG: hypothetical protein V3V26_01960 [Candidatus Aenigmarchaeota archaeon]